MHKVWISGKVSNLVFFSHFCKKILISNKDLSLEITSWVKSNDIFFWNDLLADNRKTEVLFKLLHRNCVSGEHFRLVAHKLGDTFVYKRKLLFQKMSKNPILRVCDDAISCYFWFPPALAQCWKVLLFLSNLVDILIQFCCFLDQLYIGVTRQLSTAEMNTWEKNQKNIVWYSFIDCTSLSHFFVVSTWNY